MGPDHGAKEKHKEAKVSPIVPVRRRYGSYNLVFPIFRSRSLRRFPKNVLSSSHALREAIGESPAVGVLPSEIVVQRTDVLRDTGLYEWSAPYSP
jgi:hypothetical protein